MLLWCDNEVIYIYDGFSIRTFIRMHLSFFLSLITFTNSRGISFDGGKKINQVEVSKVFFSRLFVSA